MDRTNRHNARSDQRLFSLIAVVLTLLMFALAAYSIRTSRSDSYELLAQQGRAFTEALAQASENTIVAETYYDYFVRARFSDLVVTLLDRKVDEISEQEWSSLALSHDLYGIYVYDTSSQITAGVTVRGGRLGPPPFVEAEVDSLFASPESRFVLLLDDGSGPGEAMHYYLELTSSMDRVVVISAEALFFADARNETGIERLASVMARIPGVEYIVYQTPEGLAFSSGPATQISDIESDEFLRRALDADSIVERLYEVDDVSILELVRPFSTDRDPFGLFRVGLSMDRYYAVSRGYDAQIIIMSAILVVLLLVALAYLNGRRKRLEMKVTFERQAERRERLSEMGNLAAGVAHEIRNPLNAISIAAQRLAKEFTPTENVEQYQSFTGQIRSETKRLNDTITRFLALAREDKKATGTMDLAPFLVDMGQFLRVEADKIGLTVDVTCEPGIKIEADPDRMREVFLNLFNNSKEALAGKPGRFKIAARAESDKVIIGVSDDGPGIPEEHRDKVFTPYYTSKEAGTGLGLPTVQRIVTDMGGDVELRARSEVGTRFVIEFPL